MTISLTGAGSLGVKWGHLGGYFNDLLSLQGATATTNVASGSQPATRLTQIEADYAAGTVEYAVLDGFATTLAGWQTTPNTLIATLTSLVSATLIDMANADTALASKTLPNALALLVQQMTVNSTSVNACVPAVGAQTAVGTPVGNPTVIFSVLDALGRTQQYVFPESLRLTITGDSQSGSTAGQEPFQLTGQAAQTNLLAWDWLTSKYGSGINIAGALTDGSVASGNNLTVNGDFRLFTGASANYPDNWITTVGAAGTAILNGGSTFSYLTGGGSLKFVGDSSTLTGIAQAFNTTSTTINGAGGAPTKLLAGAVNNAQYCANIFYKLDSASPAAGVLRLSVTDGSNTILLNDAGNALSKTVTLSAVANTAWHSLSLTFGLPQVLPTTVRVRLDLSTALTTGTNVYLSDVAVCLMSQLYAGGPYVAAFSGSTGVNASGIAPDSWTFAVTNTVGVLQKVLWRTLNPATVAAAQGTGSPYYTPGNGYVIPTSGSPTIADALVV